MKSIYCLLQALEHTDKSPLLIAYSSSVLLLDLQFFADTKRH